MNSVVQFFKILKKSVHTATQTAKSELNLMKVEKSTEFLTSNGYTVQKLDEISIKN